MVTSQLPFVKPPRKLLTIRIDSLRSGFCRNVFYDLQYCTDDGSGFLVIFRFLGVMIFMGRSLLKFQRFHTHTHPHTSTSKPRNRNARVAQCSNIFAFVDRKLQPMRPTNSNSSGAVPNIISCCNYIDQPIQPAIPLISISRCSVLLSFLP